MQTILLTISLVLLSLFGPMTSVHAQGAMDVEKEYIESSINSAIQKLLQIDGLKADGSALVERVNDYYAVTFPYVYYGFGNRTADVGIIAANIIPDYGTKSLTGSVALPNEIALLNKDKEIVSGVVIGKQSNKFTWYEETPGRSNVLFNFQNSVVDHSEWPSPVEVQEIEVYAGPLGDNKKQILRFDAKNIKTVTDDVLDNQNSVEIGSAHFEQVVRPNDLNWFVGGQDESNDKTKFVESRSYIDLKEVTLLSDKMKTPLVINNLTGSKEFTFSDDNKTVSGRVELMADVKDTLTEDGAIKVFPAGIEVNAGVQNMPANAAIPILTKETTDEDEPILNQIIDLIAASDNSELPPSLIINKAVVDLTNGSSFELKGRVDSEPEAPTNIVTQMTLSISKWDDLSQKIQQSAQGFALSSAQKDGNMAKSMAMIPIMMGISFLEGYGQKVVNKDGSISLNFEVVMGKDGKTIINNKPLSFGKKTAQQPETESLPFEEKSDDEIMFGIDNELNGPRKLPEINSEPDTPDMPIIDGEQDTPSESLPVAQP